MSISGKASRSNWVKPVRSIRVSTNKNPGLRAGVLQGACQKAARG